MGNQPLTPTTTTVIKVLSLTDLSQPLTNVLLKVVTTDDFGKTINPQPPTVPFKEISQEGISFQGNPLIFNLFKHPNATHFRVSLEIKGTFSNSILGTAYFSLSSFEYDKYIIFDIDLLSSLEIKILIHGEFKYNVINYISKLVFYNGISHMMLCLKDRVNFF